MKKYISEILGTFFIAIALGISANYIAVGAVVACLSVISFPLSGSHFNPAITLALLIQKKIRLTQAIGYVVAQFVGVIFAIVLFYFLFGRTYVLMPQQGINIIKPLFIEITFTFFIVLVYLRILSSSIEDVSQKSNYLSVMGLAIMAAGLSGSSISGGAFNPSLGLAPVLVELVIKSGYTLGHCWIYLCGPIVGSISAVIIDKYIYKKNN